MKRAVLYLSLIHISSKANMVKEFNERNSRKSGEKIVEYIEVSAKTIDDALTEASIKLGTTKMCIRDRSSTVDTVKKLTLIDANLSVVVR